MWFLTVDPLVWVSVFIAKFSKRQYCWRVLEDFHCQEYIQFLDIHNCLFMRLHFSIGGYDYRRTTRLRQGIHLSITQVLFADHVHWRSGVDNKFSFLRFESWCRQTPIFRRWEECCFVFLLHPGTTRGTKLSALQMIFSHVGSIVALDHWSIRRNTRFHRKAFLAIKLLAHPRGLSLSRICPFLWHKLWPLHSSALHHWP